MANEEQLAILMQGVDVWNAWWLDHPDMMPNLEGANLQGRLLSGAIFYRGRLYGAKFQRADLQRADFRAAGLQDADFQEADLRRIEFQRADLQRANLQGADLREADLSGAILGDTKLIGASLVGANLRGAILTGTLLAGTDLTQAEVGSTSFDDLDLRDARGLDTLQHIGPSSIGINTIYRSEGNIPEVFLRGCGVPDSMIEYARSLVAALRPIDYYSVFISYASEDQACAERLHADLQSKGVRCWFAPHDLEIGEVIIRGIDEAIRIYDKLLIILSEASVNSHWVAFEVNQALHREIEQGRTMLFPIRLDDTVLHTPSGWAAQIRTRHIGDFRSWKDHDRYQEAFARLLRDLKAKEESGE